jgi:metallo-beta-lactamase family protein
LKITFLGAAGTVTGSCHLVEVGGHSLLLDCGQFQGTREEEQRNRKPLPVAGVDAVVLSHAHIDHSGRLPLLAKQGFRGPIYTHEASRDLCAVMLRDAAYLQEKDAEWENKRRRRKGLKTVEPLYTRDDAAAVLGQFVGLEFDAPRRILPGVEVCLRRAGHILGAAIVELSLEENGIKRKVVFSGDLGYSAAPVMGGPAQVEHADLVLMESTYGDRAHRSFAATLDELKAIFREAAAGGGNVLIPAFAVGRTQDLLYLLAEHYDEWDLSRWQLFLDSPMAIETTQVYWRHRELVGDTLFRERKTPVLSKVQGSQTTEDSMRINAIESGAMVIAGSGMCTGGRILHHLKHNLWRPECHVVIIGYQAHGTLGRRLVDGASHVRIFQEAIRVEARIHTVGGLSAHADRDGLVAWYGGFSNRPPVRLVHGEPRAQDALAATLRATYGGVDVRAPAHGETVTLS